MRTWIALLLAVGIGTAAGMQWWRGREVAEHPSQQDGQQVAALDESAAAAPDATGDESPRALESTDAGSTSAPSETSDTTVDTEPLLIAEAMSNEAEVEVPGGSTSETDAEARRKALALVEQSSKSTNPVEQAKLLTQALKSGALVRADDEKAYSALLEANKRGILNPRVDDLCMRTTVKKGDNLWGLCKRVEKEAQVRVAPGLIRLVNGLTSDSIYAGASLKVPNVPVAILVEKSRFRLTVFLGEVMVRRYQVGLGKNNGTPEGEFSVASRLIDPPWFKPGTGQVAATDPENILGTRWLGFGAKEGFPDAGKYGIHGTKDDPSIGTESSAGCVRMHNHDVEELFEWVPNGTKVQIVP
jgi:hypothetical protein